MRKKVLSILLALCMVLSLTPVASLATDQTPTCNKIEHTHTTACYQSQLTCNLVESVEHTHIASCYQDVLTCKEEEHAHGENCYTVQKPTEPAEPSAYEKVVALFSALPEVGIITPKTTDEVKATIMAQVQTAMDAYDALPENAQTLFDTEHNGLLIVARALNDALTSNTMVTLNALSVTLYVSNTAKDDKATRADNAEYKTLGGAIDAATSGDTIILNTDINEDSVLIGNKNLTIDFKGKRVTCSSTNYAINPYGTTQLTLKDSSGNNSGGADATGTMAACIQAEGAATVTIESGSYTAKMGNCVEAASGSTGQVIINGGSFTSSSSCVYNDGNSARIFLNGGTFTGNISGANSGVLLTPEVLDQVYEKNNLYNNIYIHFPSGSNKLTKDLDLHDWQLRVLGGENTTIDLNGFNITGNGMMDAPSEGGSVIIGDINNLSCLIQVHPDGKLTLKNTGACDDSHGRIHNDATPLIYIIKNFGDLTLDGNLRIDAGLTCSGEYTQSGAVFMYSTFNLTDAVATLTVNDGVEITAKKKDATTTYFTNGILVGSEYERTGNNADRIKITINGGTIYGDYYAMSLSGTLTINGGTFKNSDTATSEVFYIGYPVANLTGIDNASFIGKSKAMCIGSQAFLSDTITVHNTKINGFAGGSIDNAIAQQGENKNVIITGKDTYWVANALTFTDKYCKGTIQIHSGIFSADPTSYVPVTNGAKDYAVLDYTNDKVSNYYLVAPWTEVGTDNIVNLNYLAGAKGTATASDDVSIVALKDTENIIPDATRVQPRHFTLSSKAGEFTGIKGLSVTGFTNGDRLTVQKTKACNATEAYVWYGGRNVGRIIIESKETPKHTVTFDANGGSVTPTSAKTNEANRLDSLPTPTRDGGYSFDGWYTAADGGTKVTPDTVFTKDSTIYAHWTYNGGSPTIYYTITATADTGGTISPVGNVTVGLGESKSFTITANPDYAISDVKVDGVSKGAISTYTFTNITANHTIMATYEKLKGDLKGELTVSKTVTGGGNKNALFTFRFTFSEAGKYGYTGSKTGSISNGGRIQLKHGESVTITIPRGVTYTVVEDAATRYIPTPKSRTYTGTITATPVTANFENRYDEKYIPPEPTLTGSLKVKKTVKGDLGDKDKKFAFIVTFNADGQYRYIGSKSGVIESGDTLWLRHGEYVKILNLPEGTDYSVKERENSGYKVDASGETGVIVANDVSTAAFTNSRSGAPKTGDDNSLLGGMLTMVGGILGMATLLVLNGRKRRKNQGEGTVK